jgi:hypothetical protein
MSDRFCIHKTNEGPWEVCFPDGFDRDGRAGQLSATFEDAVATFAEAVNRECPMCLKGAVVDTDWGWECEACGCYDVAVGCEKTGSS